MQIPDPFHAAGPIFGWRIDTATFAHTWNSGIGAHAGGGRWNSQGTYAVYACFNPAAAILEVAVHKGFKALDKVRHTLTQFRVPDPADIMVVTPDMIPNPHWLNPVPHNPDQQQVGEALLATGKFIAIPSAVSQYSWNLLFDPSRAKGRYALVDQTAFALDPRLSK